MPRAASYSVQTSASAAGAVAVIQLSAPEIDAVLASLGIGRVALGQVKVRDLLGVDRGVVARWSDTGAHLMPHGGVGVLRALARALEGAGVVRRDADARDAYPEARTEVEARMLAALARAASPLAVDLLLDQPRRWAGVDAAAPRPVTQRDLTLRRLIHPPLVVALGPPNVGKSTLANVLAGRAVAVVADQPGTTRDHVGVMLDLGGLVVRYVDTPGLRDTTDPIEEEAHRLAEAVARRADLIVLIGDTSVPPPAPPPRVDALTLASRIDLGRPLWPHDAAVSAPAGTGISGLVSLIRDRLVPPAMLADPHPWVFWE